MKVSDLVLIVDDLAPRKEWLLDSVLKAIEANDGRVCHIRIQTKNNELIRLIVNV